MGLESVILNAMTLSRAQGCFLRKTRDMFRIVVCALVPERTDDMDEPVDEVVRDQLRGLALLEFLGSLTNRVVTVV